MNKYLAELVGTFALVLCGTGAIIVDEETHGAVGHIGISLTFGLIVFAMIQAFGKVSGAHLNPAVTFGFFAAKRFPASRVLPYVFAQLFGALLASITWHLLLPSNVHLGGTFPSGSVWAAFAMELVSSFLLMLVILGFSTGGEERGRMAGIAIGSTVGLEALFAGPFTGASMNPARSLAPALVSDNLTVCWLYILAPILGMLGAALLWRSYSATPLLPR